MLVYPDISPVAFHIGTWPVYWYGLMYLIGFLGGWALLALRARNPLVGFTQEAVSDICFYVALGVVIGGRVGYILFYDWRAILNEPLLILQPWKGGMSFHGGLLGVLVAILFCQRQFKKTFLELTDFIAPVVPIGLGAGRIGNFINSELWGRVTDLPWGMVFPNGGPDARHPSQLYEFALEGIAMFCILWLFSSKPRPVGAVSGLFALCYGIFRCMVEFFREPDGPIGYIAFGWLTEGQLLSLPLIIVGIILLSVAYWKRNKR